MSENTKCPVCGGDMYLIFGCGWDYDRLLCCDYECIGERELDKTTEFEQEDNGQ